MKALIAVAVLVLSFGLVFGQGFSIGANVGGSYNTANSGIEGDEAISGLGFGGGLAADLDFMPMLGAEIDIQYAMYKYSSSYEFGTDTYDVTSTMNNIVVPVLLKYKMAMPTVSPYFVLGPSLIYGLTGSVSMSGAGVDTTMDIESEDLETDFGIQVGAGANLGMMAPMTISPYVRFQYNLTADDPDTEDNSESAYDILFGVNFMYKIK